MANDFHIHLPRKRMGVGVLIFNDKDELLIVKPSYKDRWSIPGGGIDENESPKQGCIRETKEGVGIELINPQFLCVDYTPPRDEKNESLQFTFYGGKLKPGQEIKIDGEEIIDYKFVSIDNAVALLGGLKRNLARRLPKCLGALKRGIAIYLEDGE